MENKQVVVKIEGISKYKCESLGGIPKDDTLCTIKLYSVNELPKDVQEKIIEKERYKFEDTDLPSEFVEDDLTNYWLPEVLKKYGLKLDSSSKVFVPFDLYGSGHGASVDAWVSYKGHDIELKSGSDPYIQKVRDSTAEYGDGKDLSDEVRDIMRKVNSELYSTAEKDYEAEISDENILDSLETNERYFTKNGRELF